MALKDKPLEMSEVEIQDWEAKDKFKRKVQVFNYPVELGKQEVDKYWVVAPDRNTLNAISAIAQKGDVGKVNELMINTFVLAGEIEKLEYDDALFYGLLTDIGGLGELKKRV